MNKIGLDYNTTREKLVLPEYGREIQQMVDYCVELEDRKERQRCAESIIKIMDRMFPETEAWKPWAETLGSSRHHEQFPTRHRLSFDVSNAAKIAKKPETVEYPNLRIPVRHYGAMLFEIFEKLKHMEPGKERDELVKLTANQMHRNLMQWSHGSCDEQKVAADLARFTDGKIKLDLKHFVFEKVKETPARSNNNNNKKKK